MANIDELCEKSGIFVTLEFLAEKLGNICDTECGIYRGMLSEEDLEDFLKPYKEYFDKATIFLEYGEYEFYLYTNRLSELVPLPIPAVIGLSHDIEIFNQNVVCSQDLLLELVNIANLRKDNYINLDIMPITILLYEKLHLNYIKILTIIFQVIDNKKMGSENLSNFLNKIDNVRTTISNEIYFTKIMNKFAYLTSRDVISNIILPLNKRQNPFKSSNTFQINEDTLYFLNEYNNIILEEKKQLMIFLFRFLDSNNKNFDLNSKIMEYIMYFSGYLDDTCFNCYDNSELWSSPYVFNQHILSYLSTYHYPLNLLSPELFLYTTFVCILKATTNIENILLNDDYFDFIFKILFHISQYTTQIQLILVNESIFKPGRNILSYPCLLYLCILIRTESILNKATNLSLNQRNKLNSVNIEKMVDILIENGALIWLRRIIYENLYDLSFEICLSIHILIINFIVTFSDSISSWFRKLNDEKHTKNIVYIRNLSLLICDFYGSNHVKKLFGNKNPLCEYFNFFDVSNMSISTVSDSSFTSTRERNSINDRNLAILNFVLKIFASSTKFHMIEIIFCAFYGLSNSSYSSNVLFVLLETPNMTEFLKNLNKISPSECHLYLNWSLIFKIISNIPVYNDNLNLMIDDMAINRSLVYFTISFLGILFKNNLNCAVEICQNKKYDLISILMRFLTLNENNNIKSAIFYLFKQVTISNIVTNNLLTLLDNFDYSEEPIRLSENISLTSDFIRHSRICASLYVICKKDSQSLILYSFAKFVFNVIEKNINSNNMFVYNKSKTFLLYLHFILNELFFNQTVCIYDSAHIRWKLIYKCIASFKLIIDYFALKIKSVNYSPNSANIATSPGNFLNFNEIIVSFGTTLTSYIYQNELIFKIFVEIIKNAIAILLKNNSALNLNDVVIKTLSISFKFLNTMIIMEESVFSNLRLLPSSMIYTPLSEIIVKVRSTNGNMPILYEFMKIFLIDNVSCKVIDSFTNIFCVCLKSSSSHEIISHRLQNQSLESRKILHKFVVLWNIANDCASVDVKLSKTVKSYANFIIKLFEYSLYEITDILLFGKDFTNSAAVTARDDGFNSDSLSINYLQNYHYMSFSSIIHVLYKSEFLYSSIDDLKIYERLFCIISISLSYYPYRKFLLPLLRKIYNYDFIFYMLNVLNKNTNSIRQILNIGDIKKNNYFLRLIGSVIYIIIIDLSESISNKDNLRTDKLLSALISNSINDSSILVQLAKYTLSASLSYPRYDFDNDTIFTKKYIDSIIDESIEKIHICPKDLMDLPLNRVNLKKLKKFLCNFTPVESLTSFNDNVYHVNKNNIINWVEEINIYEENVYSRYYLLDSINLSLSCVLLTKSNTLKMLSNSDQQLLDIIKHIIDYTHYNLNSYNLNMIKRQFNMLNIILCLNNLESFLSVSFKTYSVLCLPQNLMIIVNHIIDYQCRKDINCISDDYIKSCYYSSLIYIKITCDKMIKYFYLNENCTNEQVYKRPYNEVINNILGRLSTEPILTYLMDDYQSNTIDLQVVCIETIFLLIKNNVKIDDLPILDYLFYIDFYTTLLQLLMKHASNYCNFISGLGNSYPSVVRCIELIMNCFLAVLSSNGGIHILYKCDFINKLNESNIMEYPINLINNPIKLVKDKNVSLEESFQRVYSPVIDILCSLLQTKSSFHHEIVILMSKVLLKNIHSFKSIIEFFSINDVVLYNSRPDSFNRSKILILSSTIKFCSELAMTRNKIIANTFNSINNKNYSKYDENLFEPISGFFESFVYLLRKFSDNKYITNILSLYLQSLLNQSNISDEEKDSFNPPIFSYKTVTTLKDLALIIFHIVRYFQHYILIYPGCKYPHLSELIFMSSERYSNLSNEIKFVSQSSHSSTNSYSKPPINHLFNTLNILIEWQSSINNSLLLIKRCLNNTEYSAEISNLSNFHSKWSEIIHNFSKNKQKEFSLVRLQKLKNRYLNLSKFFAELIERILTITTVHAKFYEDRFHSKLIEFKTTQLFNKTINLSELLEFLSNKDNEAKMISEFIRALKTYFTSELCKRITEILVESKSDQEPFGENLIFYLEKYLVDLK